MSRTINIGLVGFGWMGQAHSRSYRSIPVYFPDENHWVRKPHNSIFWHETVLQWLDRWTDEP